MRIHSLSIEGFGPFKDQQVIDFDALSIDKIFMLEGPTGAGKSSIIDAIVYALYGKTAHEAATSDGPAGKRVRSDYCEPGDETKVSMEFTTGGSRYRINRVAEYDAPKKRGEGTTRVNAKATLEFINPVHEAIHQVREVNLRIKEELHLHHEQFSQMVVLPQGDFASFLHATTEKRREVLEQIFKTFFYDKIKSQLEGSAATIKAQLAASDQEISHHFRNLQREWREESGEIDFEKIGNILLDPNEPRVAKDEKLTELLGALYLDGEKDQQLEASLRAEQEPLLAQLNALQESLKKIEERDSLASERAELLEDSERIALLAQELKLFEKVSGLSILLENRDQAIEEMETALANIAEEYQEFTSTHIKARIKELNSTLPQLSKLAGDAEKAAEKLADLEEKASFSREIEEAIATLDQLHAEVLERQKVLTAAEKVAKDYRKRQHEEAAYEVAKLLVANHPCPVCGSKSHPAPLKGEGTFDDDHMLELESAVERARTDLSEAKSAERDALALSKRTFKSSKELEAQIEELQKLMTNAEEVIEERDSAIEELEELNESLPFFLNYESAEERHTKAQKRIDSELAKHEIPDEDRLLEILQTDKDALTLEVQSHSDRLKELAALLDQPDYKKLQDSEKIQSEIQKFEARTSEVAEQISQVTERLALLTRINDSLDEAAAGIRTALDNAEQTRSNGAAYLQLQDWVNGKNKAGLSLTNFVLQERLELILEYASRHLRRVSNGKYEFRLFEEKQGKTRKAGLGITVMDYFAGKERPAETLSGGETFYASLALALGLVEVVKADNGGIELGTLFIDEGFGSLSEDTLEEVLDVLEDLRADRVIGIISHVEGMKTQIPMRLEVRPSLAGPSTVKMAVRN
jgi:DNA repair protein SbcC/Rad50